MLSVLPGGLEPVGTREVHTMIYQMNMVTGVPWRRRARRHQRDDAAEQCPGEVQSWSGAMGMPANDFPAQSFFDVFVDVDWRPGEPDFRARPICIIPCR